ncbi:hypothetical protein ACFYYD_35105 [Streptomyces bluensis]|uniref:hypothetical protein n=1 Tax=Streptomyces bluensis TaxID=33897 RepID=UPI003684B6B9
MRQRPRTARCLCDFDSSVAAVRAVSRFLRGKDFRGLGVGPGSAWPADLVSHLPSPARRRLFTLTAQVQGAPLPQVRRLRGEDLAAWTAEQYGPGPYPAAFIGAGSGAAEGPAVIRTRPRSARVAAGGRPTLGFLQEP